MQSLNFQSYLVLGQFPKRREATVKLLKETGISISKVSPDISIVAAPKKDVTINQVREIRRTIFQKPVSLPYKIVIIEEAENLNVPAQNALLKILEEPPSSAVIILEAKDKTQLLPTILSRVVTITTEAQREVETKSILIDTKDTLTLLEEISRVENPSAWLDAQILALYDSLQKSAKSPSRHSGEQSDPGIREIENAIRQCAAAKEMIEANVNPHHVLANLIFSLK